MNRCDVTPNDSLSAMCTGEIMTCDFFYMYDGGCALEYNGGCLCLAAIRAAIEAERVADGSKTMEADNV